MPSVVGIISVASAFGGSLLAAIVLRSDSNIEFAGFTGGTGFQWLPYGAAPRKGLLSHGSVLSQGAKFADSSPTQRGIFVRNRLLCQEIPPPPPGPEYVLSPDEPVPSKPIL